VWEAHDPFVKSSRSERPRFYERAVRFAGFVFAAVLSRSIDEGPDLSRFGKYKNSPGTEGAFLPGRSAAGRVRDNWFEGVE